MLGEEARRAIAIAPADARGYSLLGQISEERGDEKVADELYRAAVDLSGTEIHALSRLIARSVAADDYAGALGLLDRMLRRWPERIDVVAAALGAVLESPAGRSSLSTALDAKPPWRDPMMRWLARRADGLSLAEAIELDEADRGLPVSPEEVNVVVTALMAQKDYQGAHELFLATTPNALTAGYVFDPMFAATEQRRYFGWSLSASGADVHAGNDGAGGLAVSFLALAPRLRIGQLLVLPPGDYLLSATADIAGLSAPAGLAWSVACAGGNDLGRLDVPEGSATALTLEQRFEVPEAGCPLQRLELREGGGRPRPGGYAGSVHFRALSISRE